MSIHITGSGSYIPKIVKKNKDFLEANFLNPDGSEFNISNDVIIKKFQSITGIKERRYATSTESTSDLAFKAAKNAISDSGINIESLDYIIVAHNFGDIAHNNIQTDILPSIASRVKIN